jgi:biotin carboxylase
MIEKFQASIYTVCTFAVKIYGYFNLSFTGLTDYFCHTFFYDRLWFQSTDNRQNLIVFRGSTNSDTQTSRAAGNLRTIAHNHLSSKKFTVTGAAANSRPRAGIKFCQVYFSSANGEKTYTTAEYRQRIAEYRVLVDDRKEDLDEAKAALQEAKVRQATAQRIVNAEQQASATTTTTANA